MRPLHEAALDRRGGPPEKTKAEIEQEQRALLVINQVRRERGRKNG